MDGILGVATAAIHNWGNAFFHAGGGDNLVYVSPDHDLVVVVRWLERRGRDEFFRRVLEAVRS